MRWSPLLFAHSTECADRDGWEELSSHLRAVADRAGKSAAAFGAADIGYACGLLHDLGKAAPCFQRYISGQGKSCDHSTAGAQVAHRRFGRFGKLLAFAIAGHHAGLADGGEGGEASRLGARLKKQVGDVDTWLGTIPELPAQLSPPPLHVADGQVGFQGAFWTRMLFSCLVDADRLATEQFHASVGQSDAAARRRARSGWPAFATLRPALNLYLDDKLAKAELTSVNRQRRHILEVVRSRARLSPGLFSLTVPTGGGKTLASLAFALDHAASHGLRRVIYAIPFTSIVEQTAAVFRAAIGEEAVLEHHSAFDAAASPPRDADKWEEARDGSERIRAASENWDAPVVVTTAVQLFESLFSNHPSRCRKLHNLVGAVIVLDEAQTLPLPLFKPCVAALDELARNYGASIVLCTATQPALTADAIGPGGLKKEQVRELAPDGLDAEPAFRRVVASHVGLWSDDVLLARLEAEPSALCIVNTRAHARDLYERIPADTVFHLSTLMHARHRSAVLARVRERLARRLPTRLISTSLIEAGVDISFPVVFRAAAGLDQVAQAAGRCNREGELPLGAPGRVVVFESERTAPPELAQRAQAAAAVLRTEYGRDPLSSEAIAAFYSRLYHQKGAGELGSTALDRHQVMKLFNERATYMDFPFTTVSALFKMIENTTTPVIIPFDPSAPEDETAANLVDRLKEAEHPGGIARRLQPYTAHVTRQMRDVLFAAGALYWVQPDKFGQQFAVLAQGFEHLYRADLGLVSDDPTFMAAEKQIF